MTYKEINYDKDIPEVVELLRSSLSDQHTKTHFLWKHYHNPFGKSYGILAYDKDKIIGVRMFMRWEFLQDGKVFKAARPVDTVTHKDYRHRGIFSELTKRALHWVDKTTELIFNTPNENSAPGNLKLGWKKQNNFTFYKLAFLLPSYYGVVQNVSIYHYDQEEYIQKHSFVRTHLTNKFIHWRYSNEIYKAAVFEYKSNKIFIIYRISSLKNARMIILMEIIGDSRYHAHAIKALIGKLRIFLLYYLSTGSVNINTSISRRRNSPLVLCRDDKNKIFESISLSLGDIEGRI
jgi:GNAT superfamily N-acetyltransferase